jgi:hypothetical protein
MNNPANVTEISNSGFTLTTGSPTWVSVPVTVPPGFDMIRFNYEFLSSAHGRFQISVDGTNVFEAVEDFSPGLQDSGWLLLADDPAKTNFVVTALIDSAGGPTSSLRVSGFQAGQMKALAVPAPALAIESAGTQLKLKWSRWHDQMQLESAQTLGGTWAQVPGQPRLESNWLFVLVSPSQGSMFFRLKQ